MESILEKLYIEHSHGLYRFAVGLTGDRDEANDIIQNIFARLALRPDQTLSTISKTYLYVAVRNGAKDFWKRKRPIPLSKLTDVNDEDGDKYFEMPDDSLNPEEQAEINFDLEVILKTLDRLTEEQREVLMAKYFSGLSTSEVANLVDKSENTVRQIEFRALRSLCRELRKQKYEI